MVRVEETVHVAEQISETESEVGAADELSRTVVPSRSERFN